MEPNTGVTHFRFKNLTLQRECSQGLWVNYPLLGSRGGYTYGQRVHPWMSCQFIAGPHLSICCFGTLLKGLEHHLCFLCIEDWTRNPLPLSPNPISLSYLHPLMWCGSSDRCPKSTDIQPIHVYAGWSDLRQNLWPSNCHHDIYLLIHTYQVWVTVIASDCRLMMNHVSYVSSFAFFASFAQPVYN